MNWFDILKKIKIVSEKELEPLSVFVRAEDKGYPSVIHPLNIVADFDDNTGKLTGYTSFKEFPKFYFVGNSFVFEKGKGLFPKLMDYRNNNLGNKPKVTLLNPIQGTSLSRLEDTVKRRGGEKIESYEQVEDIMDNATYNEMKKLTMYRYRD